MKKVISLILIALMCLGMTAFAQEVPHGITSGDPSAPVSEPVGDGDSGAPKSDAPTLTPQTEIPIKLIVDDKVIPAETVTINDRTLIPLRALMESTGAEVNWLHESWSADVTKDGKTINVKIDSNIMTTPNGNVEMDVAPILHNGDTTYVPLRAICEEYGFKVEWDEGTKTILISDPNGCPYVDTYDGLTLGEYLENVNMTGEQFAQETGLDYEYYKDRPFVFVDNALPVSYIMFQSGITAEDFANMVGVESIDPNQPWGEFMGNLTMKQYIENLTPAIQYGMTAEDAFASMKLAYGLGDEYTLETQYKFVRTIMAIADYEYQKEMEAQEKAAAEQQEAMMNAGKEALPELLKNKIYFTITMSDGSKMKGELYPDLAPITVENFVKLCNEGFYDGLIFHRVIDGFMIQGGAFDKDFNHKESPAIKGEFYANNVTNALSHEKGVISMARTDDPNSASSQFFIMDEDNVFLDGQYAAFGKITKGLDVVDKISQVETTTNDIGYTDVPVKPIVIKSIKIDK